MLSRKNTDELYESFKSAVDDYIEVLHHINLTK